MELKELLRYGEIIITDEIEHKDGSFITIRIIKYDGKTYYHKMIDGEMTFFMVL